MNIRLIQHLYPLAKVAGMLLLILGFIGCSDSNQVARFNIEQEAVLDLPAALNTFETHFFLIRNQESFIESLLQSNGMTINDVGEVRSSTATVIARNTAVDLSFIQDITIRAVSIANPSKNFEMFYLDPVQFNEDNRLDLLASLSDVRDVVLEGRYDLEIRITLRRFVPSNVTLDINFFLSVFESTN